MAEVTPFPRQGFIIGDHLCRHPGTSPFEMCFAERDHEGEHQWRDWRGCFVRAPFGDGVVRFGGFAQ